MATVCYVKQEHKATVKAFEVREDFRADIVVHLVKAEHQAKDDFLWFLTEQEHKATTKLFWVTQESRADIKVCFTDQQHRAKWSKSHRLQKRL